MKTKRTGFTLVELLVVIAIIALLMGILMPALAKVRHIAYRMVCGSNIAGIGKAMLVYANDNREEFPRSGGPNSQWTANPGGIQNFQATTERLAFNNQATITSCFYLLIRNTEMPPKQFNCKGDVSVKEMKKNELRLTTQNVDYKDLWDFSDGTQPANIGNSGMYCSYSYHDPFQGPGGTAEPSRVVRATSLPDTPVVADRNPLLDKNAVSYWGGRNEDEDNAPTWQTDDPQGPLDLDKTMNSASHQRDGQNVLFNDTHVTFELFSFCGIEKDNLWQHWQAAPQGNQFPPAQEITGITPRMDNITLGEYGPMHEKDAWLINEWNEPTGPRQN